KQESGIKRRSSHFSCVNTVPVNTYDTWAPWFFAAYVDCAEHQWSFLNREIPEWLVLIFGIHLVTWLLILIANSSQKGRFGTCVE
ncbi:disulfide bond formation protein B, partial [Aeromonas sp. QDB05]|uniref:disulfide bond formation protein B n=1 Tax=Aeromonas sp. QDB05 TaxID=2990478 RepID=UPI0022E58333